MLRETVQIATIGKDTDTVVVGIRNFPCHRLVLICQDEDKEAADRFRRSLRDLLRIPIDLHSVSGNILQRLLEIISEVLKKHGKGAGDVIMNVAGGDKILTCSALSAAFINGIKAFHVMKDMPIMLPIMKLSYSEVISKTKMEILRVIDQAGGEVESLEQLSNLTKYGKPLLSYHIHGAEDSRGLVELGLVEVERLNRGRSRIRITTLGKALLIGMLE